MPTQEQLSVLGMDWDSYREAIAKKTYEIYEGRMRGEGEPHATEKDDWYFAESIINFNIVVMAPLARLQNRLPKKDSMLDEILYDVDKKFIETVNADIGDCLFCPSEDYQCGTLIPDQFTFTLSCPN